MHVGVKKLQPIILNLPHVMPIMRFFFSLLGALKHLETDLEHHYR